MADTVSKEAEQTYISMINSVKEVQVEKVQVQELQEELRRINEISGEIKEIITSIEQIILVIQQRPKNVLQLVIS